MQARCCAGLSGAEAEAFSAQPLCTLSSGAFREDPAQAGCAVAFDMVDAHTGSPPCRKAVHSTACALRGAGTWVSALRLCIAPIAVRCESCQKHDKKDDRCEAGELGAKTGRAVRPAAEAAAVRHTPLPGHTPSHPVQAVRCEVCLTTLQGEGDAVETNTGQAHRNLHSPKSFRSQRGACHSRHSFAAPVGSLHGGAVRVPVSGLSVQCWELHGPNPHHSLCRGGAVRNPHHHLHLDAVPLAAVRGVAHCSLPVRRRTTQAQGVLSPHLAVQRGCHPAAARAGGL